jgi:ADP-heptose:LPS heptosyltransferase
LLAALVPAARRSTRQIPILVSPRSIAVFRALMLGDMLCATPALRALRQGFPQARITLIGLPWARELAQRLPTVDAFEPFPGWPGLPESEPPSPAEADAFIVRQRAQRYDLALQMHGSGEHVNALVASFGAKANGGFAAPGVWSPPADAARFMPWPTGGSEVRRLLALTDRLGLPRLGEALDFPIESTDRQAVPALQPTLPYAILHPGSQWPSRRWPAERFAAVGDALAARGMSVLVTGTSSEADITRRVIELMGHHATDLAGLTTLGTLGALVERAAVIVCNDTGMSHVAAALGTPSVVVSSGSDVVRWAPANGLRHRVLWQDMPCRPCAYRSCPVTTPCRHPCAAAITSDTVILAASAQLELGRCAS